MTPAKANIIICRCREYARVDKNNIEKIIGALKNTSIKIIVFDDLCGSAVHDAPLLEQHLLTDSLTIAACAPRAVRALLDFANLSPKNASFLDITKPTPNLAGHMPENLPEGKPSHVKIPCNRNWTPWYPVIDRQNCKNCGQCLNFCLFGVYQTSQDKKVKVERPSSCKTNCPACSRVCPANAVIFPKHSDPRINGTLHKPAPEKEKPISKTDIYQKLRSRESTNFQKLQNELKIPDSVIKQLTPDQLKNINKR